MGGGLEVKDGDVWPWGGGSLRRVDELEVESERSPGARRPSTRLRLGERGRGGVDRRDLLVIAMIYVTVVGLFWSALTVFGTDSDHPMHHPSHDHGAGDSWCWSATADPRTTSCGHTNWSGPVK